MLNSKIINIGALLLFMYCLYESKPFENLNLGYEIKDGSVPKYSFKVNIDENSSERTFTDKVLTSILSSKIEKAKALSKQRQNFSGQKDESIYLVLAGDKVSFSYILQNIDGSNEEGYLDGFVVADDIVSDGIKGMKMLEQKSIAIIPDATIPSFLKGKKSHQTIAITIKSLTKSGV